ncbi:hypothetical protein LJC20_00490 [Eubacteriales bacterium OttesenSCG-928-M02]|nr:hypothetical protein [Eubacteriales bacterium OttesenSCG-928-M02]
MADVVFKDNTLQVMAAIEQKALAFLYEAAGEIESQTIQKSRRDTGQTAGSFQHVVDEGRLVAHIGSSMENAIWEEYGTGEFALKGNGRKGGWRYKDKKGDWHFTMGKRPNRAFYSAFKELERPIQTMAQKYYRELNNGK